jgi:tripartite-type tricarboxylate transporter receptor subunit TctC
VPYPAGGTADILARVLSQEISKAHGPTIVIEDRPGAGSVIGTETASRAAPDGSTLLLAANPYLINPLLHHVNYDPLTSFEPICYLVKSPAVFVVNKNSPYHTLKDLIDAAQAKPAQLTLASVGPGSSTQIAFEMLKREAKFNMTFVPFPGDGPAINALLGDHVTSIFADYGDLIEQLQAGTLRALAVASRQRVATLPGVPTVAESGYKNYELDVWFGVMAPAKTPPETQSRLIDWFSTALQVPEVKAKLETQGRSPVGMCGADFAAFLGKQYGEIGGFVRDANLRLE